MPWEIIICIAVIVGLLLFYKLVTKNDIVCYSLCAIIAIVGIILCYTLAKNHKTDRIIMAGITAFVWSVFNFNGTEKEYTITHFLGTGWYKITEESAFSVKCTLVFSTVLIACVVSALFVAGAGIILGIMLGFNLFIVIGGLISLRS